MRVNVFMLGWEFPPHISGGLGMACYGLTKSLTKKNTSIVFVLPKKGKVHNLPMKFVFADVPHVHLETIESPLCPYIDSKSYDQFAHSEGPFIYGKTLFEEVMRYANKAGKIARRENFDVIHAHDWLTFKAGIEAKKVSGKPLVVHVHATEFDRTGNGNVNQFVYDIEREGLHAADAIIAISNFVRNMLVEKYGVDPKKIHVVHNGIDLDEAMSGHEKFGAIEALKKSGKKIVLYLGRITLQKGPDYFIHTAKKVLEHNPDVIFLVGGTGDMERQMIRETAQLGISDKVIFTGFVPVHERYSFFKSADIFVMPSVSEPFGLVPLESLTQGTPVLISKQSGVSEVLTHALKADFWDTEEMANKIISVLAHPALHSCLASNGSSEVQKHSWDNAADKCVSVYKKLIYSA